MFVVGELRLTYLDRPYEIQVGLYQMIILLLFNDSTSLAVNEMAQQSGLPEIDIVRGVKVNQFSILQRFDDTNRNRKSAPD